MHKCERCGREGTTYFVRFKEKLLCIICYKKIPIKIRKAEALRLKGEQ